MLTREQIEGFCTPEARLLRDLLREIVAELPWCRRCGLEMREPATSKSRAAGNQSAAYSCDRHAARVSERRRGYELPWGKAAKKAHDLLKVLEVVEKSDG